MHTFWLPCWNPPKLNEIDFFFLFEFEFVVFAFFSPPGGCSNSPGGLKKIADGFILDISANILCRIVFYWIYSIILKSPLPKFFKPDLFCLYSQIFFENHLNFFPARSKLMKSIFCFFLKKTLAFIVFFYGSVSFFEGACCVSYLPLFYDIPKKLKPNRKHACRSKQYTCEIKKLRGFCIQ